MGIDRQCEAVTWPVALVRVAVFLAKVLAVILFFMISRWSWPRFRFDQLMDIAWKVMLPLGVVNVVVVAFWVEYGKRLAQATGLSEGVWLGLAGWAALVVSGSGHGPGGRRRQSSCWASLPRETEEVPFG